MSYRSYRYSRRAIRRVTSKDKRNFIISFILIIIFTYVALIWILPNFIGLLGAIKESLNPTAKTEIQKDPTVLLAPPILNIPYEATNTSQINIKGYSAPDSKITIFVEDDPIQTVESSSDGSFIFQDIQLALGTNNIYGKTIDNDNKISLPSKTIRVNFDDEEPILEITEPEDNKTIQGERKIKISGKTEPGAHIFINGNQSIVDNEGNFSISHSLNDGDNFLNIKAYDSASNYTESTVKVNFIP